VFGWLGDRIGRKRIYGVSLLFMIVSSLCSAMSFGTEPSAVIGSLCFFRFWLGFGVGGDYPLSATIMSEYSNKNNRGGFVAAVFAMQGIGILTAAAVALIVTAIFDHAYPGTPYGKSVDLIRGSCPKQADYVWRIVLAFGAFPALLTMYARMMMPETPRYTLYVKGNMEKATNDVARVMNNGEAIGQLAKPPSPPVPARAFWRAWWKPLLGCSMSWFLLDIAFYSQNLFQKDVFDAVGWIPKADHMNALDETFRIARAQALIALGSTVPGYWFTVFTIDHLGRKPIQFGGFLLMTIFMASLSGWYIPLRDSHQAGFVTMYALTFFFVRPSLLITSRGVLACANACVIHFASRSPTLAPMPPPLSFLLSCSPPPGRPRRTASRRLLARPVQSWAPSASCTRRSRAMPRLLRRIRLALGCAKRWACLQPSTSRACCSRRSFRRRNARHWRRSTAKTCCRSPTLLRWTCPRPRLRRSSCAAPESRLSVSCFRQ